MVSESGDYTLQDAENLFGDDGEAAEQELKTEQVAAMVPDEVEPSTTEGKLAEEALKRSESQGSSASPSAEAPSESELSVRDRVTDVRSRFMGKLRDFYAKGSGKMKDLLHSVSSWSPSFKRSESHPVGERREQLRTFLREKGYLATAAVVTTIVETINTALYSGGEGIDEIRDQDLGAYLIGNEPTAPHYNAVKDALANRERKYKLDDSDEEKNIIDLIMEYKGEDIDAEEPTEDRKVNKAKASIGSFDLGEIQDELQAPGLRGARSKRDFRKVRKLRALSKLDMADLDRDEVIALAKLIKWWEKKKGRVNKQPLHKRVGSGVRGVKEEHKERRRLNEEEKQRIAALHQALDNTHYFATEITVTEKLQPQLMEALADGTLSDMQPQDIGAVLLGGGLSREDYVEAMRHLRGRDVKLGIDGEERNVAGVIDDYLVRTRKKPGLREKTRLAGGELLGRGRDTGIVLRIKELLARGDTEAAAEAIEEASEAEAEAVIGEIEDSDLTRKQRAILYAKVGGAFAAGFATSSVADAIAMRTGQFEAWVEVRRVAIPAVVGLWSAASTVAAAEASVAEARGSKFGGALRKFAYGLWGTDFRKYVSHFLLGFTTASMGGSRLIDVAGGEVADLFDALDSEGAEASVVAPVSRSEDIGQQPPAGDIQEEPNAVRAPQPSEPQPEGTPEPFSDPASVDQEIDVDPASQTGEQQNDFTEATGRVGGQPLESGADPQDQSGSAGKNPYKGIENFFSGDETSTDTQPKGDTQATPSPEQDEVRAHASGQETGDLVDTQPVPGDFTEHTVQTNETFLGILAEEYPGEAVSGSVYGPDGGLMQNNQNAVDLFLDNADGDVFMADQEDIQFVEDQIAQLQKAGDETVTLADLEQVQLSEEEGGGTLLGKFWDVTRNINTDSTLKVRAAS